MEKVPGEADFKNLLKSHIDKNRELTAELEKVENDLEEKTELCENLSLKCEQLTKRNSRLIGQISSRISSVGDQKKQEEMKEEPKFEEQRNDSELAAEIVNLKKKNAELQVLLLSNAFTKVHIDGDRSPPNAGHEPERVDHYE